VTVKDILLRASGPYVHSEIHIEIDRTMTVGRLDEIKSQIENTVKDKLIGVQRVIVSARARPAEDSLRN
jgi:divalent metal cation (Fe/Co/Zn/Cd) transporter